MKTAKQIRQEFLDFFESRQHQIVPSSPVVIPADPTLLFANAGMNQFKEIFLGVRESAYKRVADTQKCIRVSGKHNDLEEVGRDTYHHTFFEMLGNWSFGDYYKKEAISWAWELLTGVWKLPKERMWATVFRTDDEAAKIWQECTDIDPTHILRFDEKDNFWEMGETGPCGPCSEIHFDLTVNGCTPDQVNAGTPDVIEIWNLVFMQYNRKSDGSLDELPSKCVDTGMGFERVVAVLQGKKSNYDTDVFMPLIDAIAGQCGIPYGTGETAVAMRVIADHLRALSFAIADGVMPSNDGRGYVLRRLLRRAARFGRTLGMNKPFLSDLFPILEGQMGDVFPELTARRDSIMRALRAEEESFATTLDRGIALFEATIDELLKKGEKMFPGEQAFKLYDTYGFPFDLTLLMAEEKGFTIDAPVFRKFMEQQRERARAARKDNTAVENDLVSSFVEQGLSSSFVGYHETTVATTVLAIISGGQSIESISAGEAADVLLAETPFYAESGGQVGDTGTLTTPDGAVFAVEDTQRPAQGIILHRGKLTHGTLAKNTLVSAAIDAERRDAIRRHHTATHLMNAALRKVLNADSIKQAGSYVSPERLRFDFTWFEAMTPGQLAELEREVTAYILANRAVKTYEIPLKDVPGSGIVAVFDEKYGDIVRVVDTDGISRELCGGTHCNATGDIGPFRIVAESSVAAGIRRIEAMAGFPAWEYTAKEHATLSDAVRRFSVTADELGTRLDALIDHNKKLEKELKAQAAQAATGKADSLMAGMSPIGGIPVLVESVGEMDVDGLRALTESIRGKTPDSVIVLAATADDKITFIANIGPTAQQKGLHAGKLIGSVAKVAGGGGGGKPDKAQAGGRDIAKLNDAMATAKTLIGEALA